MRWGVDGVLPHLHPPIIFLWIRGALEHALWVYNCAMTKFYTRTGDDGTTGLLGEGRARKDAPRLEAVGTLDEANAALGVARAACQAAPSPEIILTVNEGRTELPEEVQPSNPLRSIGTILLWLVVFVVIGMGVYFIWQKGWLNNLRLPKRRKREPQVQISDDEPEILPTAVTNEWEPVPADPPSPPPVDAPQYPPPGVIAFLDVLESQTNLPTEYALHGTVLAK